MEPEILKVKLLVPHASFPTRGTPKAAGLDLYAAESRSIHPGGTALVSTGISIVLPPGHEGQIRPRSGLAAKHQVTVLNSPGTIDEDYTGEVKVLLINHGRAIFAIAPGDRIAQLVVAPYTVAVVVEVATVPDTERGNGGFGSTGR